MKSVVVVLLVLCLVFVSFPQIQVNAQGAIHIRADGSVEGTDKIQRNGNIYTFTGNIYGLIVIEKCDIVVDGAGYVLDSGEEVEAITVDAKSNVTLKNIIITGSGFAIKINQSSNCVVANNTIRVNETGLLLKNSENNNILQNSIEGLWGISLENSAGNVISENNISNIVLFGVRFTDSSNNILAQNIIVANETAAPIVNLIDVGFYSSDNIIERNVVTGTRSITEISSTSGVSVTLADNNSIANNTISCNDFGLYIQGSSGNQVSSNKISSNKLGISLADSPNSLLRNNVLENNEKHFRVQGEYLGQLMNDIDVSNTADGRPIYYLVNKQNLTVSSDAGYVALVNCSGITVQNLDLSSNGQGVLLAFTSNSTIRNNDLSNNMDAIWIVSSSNNVISGNNITGTEFGVAFVNYGNKINSGNNWVANNTINQNKRGIWLSRNNNFFVGNNITNNESGVWISGSSNNTFYHNNFVNNTNTVFDIARQGFLGAISQNIWDNGESEGNYWDNYTGADENKDAIGDTPHLIYENNTDNFPLMECYIGPEYPSPPTEVPWAAGSYFPEPDSVDVPLDTTVSISFGRPPSIVELNITPEVVVKERNIENVGRYGARHIFVFSEPLQPLTTYNITVVFGTPNSTRSWSFTTRNEILDVPKDDPLDMTPVYLAVIVIVIITSTIIGLYVSRKREKRNTKK